MIEQRDFSGRLDALDTEYDQALAARTLAELREVRETSSLMMSRLVQLMRTNGSTWSAIAAALGTTTQNVQRNYRRTAQ